jgi:hypothetical protein
MRELLQVDGLTDGGVHVLYGIVEKLITKGGLMNHEGGFEGRLFKQFGGAAISRVADFDSRFVGNDNGKRLGTVVDVDGSELSDAQPVNVLLESIHEGVLGLLVNLVDLLYFWALCRHSVTKYA